MKALIHVTAEDIALSDGLPNGCMLARAFKRAGFKDCTVGYVLCGPFTEGGDCAVRISEVARERMLVHLGHGPELNRDVEPFAFEQEYPAPPMNDCLVCGKPVASGDGFVFYARPDPHDTQRGVVHPGCVPHDAIRVSGFAFRAAPKVEQ